MSIIERYKNYLLKYCLQIYIGDQGDNDDQDIETGEQTSGEILRHNTDLEDW